MLAVVRKLYVDVLLPLVAANETPDWHKNRRFGAEIAKFIKALKYVILNK